MVSSRQILPSSEQVWYETWQYTSSVFVAYVTLIQDVDNNHWLQNGRLTSIVTLYSTRWVAQNFKGPKAPPAHIQADMGEVLLL